jgi:serine/threonine protein kinase
LNNPDFQRNSKKSIVVHGIEYEVLSQLSKADRGRWKVRRLRSNLHPKKSIFTIIDIPKSRDALQFLNSLKSLPERNSGIPRFVDSDEADGQLQIVVSWCEGTDLETYFGRIPKGKASPASVWESIKRIKSLAHICGVLHKRCRIIHGDIKPANLVLPAEPGHISIIDFGSSWQIERTRGRLDGDGSDPHYSAPEVFHDGTIVDERADQFSVAVVLYRMLTGELPYSGLGGQAGRQDFVSEFENSLVPASKLSIELRNSPGTVPERVDNFLTQSLRLDANQRFPSTQAFINAIDQIDDQLKRARFSQPSIPTYVEKTIRFLDWLVSKNR